MSDPQRLLDHGDDLEVKLLSSALDEPPPPELLARTLGAVGVMEASAAAGKAGAVKLAASKSAGGGLLGAAGIGALAGLLTVGAFQLASSHDSSRPIAPAPAPAAIASTFTTSPETAVDPAPATAPPPEETRAAPRPAAPAPSAGSPRSSSLAAELEQLDEARRALREGNPALTLRLLARYSHTTPHGQMAREAEVLRAEARAALESNP